MRQLFFFVLSLISSVIIAQAPNKYSASDIQAALQKLQVLGSVLYVAAHPDDENTRLITYLANVKHYEVTYLSLTRGDGGQNLIGKEMNELLGILRTQELLMARKIDGGKQLFTRANDFGFSKTPYETFTIWNREEVLSDVVWAIRNTQPDVVINRFSNDPNTETHGHHTASAILSTEAFEIAGDVRLYNKNYNSPWQPKRLFFNTSWWFYGSQEKFEKADKSKMCAIDVGAYLPLKGKSITEIAAESRSQHRCQGFGTTGTRGEQIEYLLQLKGDTTLNNDIMYQINTTWSRVEGGASIGKLLATIEKEFDPTNPSGSISKLFVAKKMIEALPEGYWKKIKLSQIEEVIIACLGLYLEVTANDYSATQGQTIGITCEAINRSNVNVLLNSIKINPLLKDTTVSILLNYNKSFTYKSTITIPDEVQNSTHYWLTKPWTTGMYWVDDQVLRGLPETPKQIQAVFYLTIDGSPFTYLTNVVYKKNESDKGETYRPFEITPPVFVNCDEKSYISTDNSPKKIQLKVTAGIDNINGKVSIAEPESWHATPLFYDFSLAQKGQEKVFTFEVNMHDDYVNATLIPFVEIGNRKYTNSLYIVDYDHIPLQTVVRNAFPKFIKYPIKSTAKKVGYIMGAGDDVPQALRQLGCDVTLLYEADMQLETLSKFDAIVLGIRALNTVNYLKFHNPSLWEYAKNGGTLVYQYNNNFDLVTDKILPFEIKLSRERVTEENAKMKVLDSTNPIFNFPNKIDDSDFNNWVQERGLYFANTWDTQNIRPLLSCNDPNEPTREGVLLVANYGKGKIAYTGLSFFRQLPAGVIGAYKLFANIISYK